MNGHLVREAGGDTVPGALRPATTVPAVTVARPANGSAPAVVLPSSNGHGTRSADEVLTEYFRTAHEIMAAGHQLVLNYLGVEPTAAAAPAPVVPAPMALAPAPAPAAEAVEAPVAAPAAGLPPAEVLLARLTAIVSARTGYPEDMLGPDLDVEADLSIDSIKRLEILGELADAIGLSDDGSLDQLEDLVEELAARKTLRGIVAVPGGARGPPGRRRARVPAAGGGSRRRGVAAGGGAVGAVDGDRVGADGLSGGHVGAGPGRRGGSVDRFDQAVGDPGGAGGCDRVERRRVAGPVGGPGGGAGGPQDAAGDRRSSWWSTRTAWAETRPPARPSLRGSRGSRPSRPGPSASW